MVPDTADNSTGITTVAAIDIGASSLRMTIAEVSADGSIEILEQLQRSVRLGQDTFHRGRLGGSAMRAALKILRDFQQLLNFYQVNQVRAVATSAVREADNSDSFLDRIYMATGLDVELIETSEESRLTVSAVYKDIEQAGEERDVQTLIADVGGGSTLLTLLEKGEIIESHSLRLGSVRLQEALSTTNEPPQQAAELLRHQIANQIAVVQNSLPLAKIDRFIAVGDNALILGRQVGEPIGPDTLFRVRRTKFLQFLRGCVEKTPAELAQSYGLDFAAASTLTPALLVFQMLLQETRATELIISRATMRNGLLLDLARRVGGREDPALIKGLVHSALALAEKYRTDIKHANKVAEIALFLFDQLQTWHGLNPRHRLLLQVTALVHDIGTFINPRGHHKHSFYLLNHSELFGLTRNELDIVAHTARYHRRSCPKPSHLEYMQLPRERRMIISKLAALLRVADALDISHMQLLREYRCESTEDELTIYTTGIEDLTLKRRALARKADLFYEIFGRKVRLETELLQTNATQEVTPYLP